MPNINPNSTNYFHSFEPNTSDLTHTIRYNGQGEPAIRTIESGITSKTAFDEPVAIALTPVLQLDGVYGIPEDDVQTYTFGAGSNVSTNDYGQWEIAAGTGLGNYGVFRSRRVLRYRAGQGGQCRFTAMFEGGVTGTSMRVGLANQESSIMVGVNNGQFGVLRSYDARAEIRTLTITGTASNTTAVVVLDGTTYNVTLVNGETASQTAARIARTIFGQDSWLVEQKGNEVRFLSSLVGPRNGAYSYTASTTTGVFTRDQIGVPVTENWVYQADFNIDKLDGTGPSGVTIDPTKMNVFQIQYRWLGAGVIRFACENPVTGTLMLFHELHWVNEHNRPWTHNPNFKVTYVAYNIGAATACVVKGSSMMAAVEGIIQKNDYTRSFSGKKSSLTNNTVHQLFAVRNPTTQSGKINTREIVLQDVSVAFQGNDPLELMIFFEPVLLTGVQDFSRQADAIALISTTTATIDYATETPIVSFVAGLNGSAQFPLFNFRLVIPPGTTAVVACRSGQSVSQIATALTWLQD